MEYVLKRKAGCVGDVISIPESAQAITITSNQADQYITVTWLEPVKR